MKLKLKRRVAPDCQCDEDDVRALKSRLVALGYLPNTELNRTGVPNQDMFDALARFQEDRGVEEYRL